MTLFWWSDGLWIRPRRDHTNGVLEITRVQGVVAFDGHPGWRVKRPRSDIKFENPRRLRLCGLNSWSSQKTKGSASRLYKWRILKCVVSR